MVYQLVLSQKENEDTKNIKDIGENIIYDNLPHDYEVYAFYYSGVNRNEDLEAGLRNLGKIAGKNLLVNIGLLDDPKYKILKKLFEIDPLPVIIITAVDNLASPPNQFRSFYVRIDDKNLLKNSKLTIDCVERLFNLFITGEISKAMKYYDAYKEEAFFSHIKDLITNAFKMLGKILDNYNITISLMEGKFELKGKSKD